jgi:hypothetical protein
MPATTPARTLVDVLRTAEDRFRAQELVDALVRQGAPSRVDVEEALAWQRGWPGIVQAREAWAHASPLSESPLESRHRVCSRDAGLLVPEQQVKLWDSAGRLVARADFLFRAQHTIVESDGKVKYADPDDQQLRGSNALWDEKRREDRLRDLGFEVVRATWGDSIDPTDLMRRVLRAFDRAAARVA